MSFTARACRRGHHCRLCGRIDAEYLVTSLLDKSQSRYVCVGCYRALVDKSDSDSSSVETIIEQKQPRDNKQNSSRFDHVGREPTGSQLDEWEKVECGVFEAMRDLNIEPNWNNGRDAPNPSCSADHQPRVEDEASLGADGEAWPVEVRAVLASWRQSGVESVVVGEEEVQGQVGHRTVHVCC